MHRIVFSITLMAVVVISSFVPSFALTQSGKRLVTINGVEFTDVDYKNWWKFWNDKNQLKVPTLPDEYIDFQLMVQEGRDMGYDTLPNYLHKIEVFLQVRALMELKYEEIDSKVAVTDDELKKYYNENYANLWVLQVLAFDSESKAKRVYESMLPYNGQAGGRLVFSDWLGAEPDEKAETYDEVTVSVADFYTNKKSTWLPIVNKLGIGEVSKPFLNEDNKKYILLRLVESKDAGESVFSEKKSKMTQILMKEQRDNLTIKLIASLKKKYNVHVDESLFDSVKLDANLSKDYMDQKLVTMDGFNVSVGDFLYNINKEKGIRKDVSEIFLKDFVLNSIISQTLVNRESLARGYEKRLPLLLVYEFYKQNRLRSEFESGLKARIVISDQDIDQYYDTHKSGFTVSGKLTFILVKADEGILQQIWLGTTQGSEFADLTDKYSLDVKSQTSMIADLPVGLIDEIKKLENGGVGLPFAYDGTYALIKLIDRTPDEILPLNQVKDKLIEQMKKEQFEIVKTQYLAKIKSKSKIDINQRVWAGLVRELNNAKNE